MLSFIFVIVCGILEWMRICAGFFLSSLVYIPIAVGDLIIKSVGFPITSLSPPHFCAYHEQCTEFQMSYVMVLRRELIFDFVVV